MKKPNPLNQNILRNLGDGLVLRRATQEDTQKLVEFNGRIHVDSDSDQPNERVAAWVRDLMEKPHPTFQKGDFTIVEDTRAGKIVSSLNLIPQTWSYSGIPFGAGRPELVGTDPEYRNKGLVRAQFEEIHRWSEERGHMLQAITGIPYYYRQFGYEMGLELGAGRIGYPPHVPKLKDGEEEPYRIRPAVEADIPFIADLYNQAMQRYLIAAVWDEALWRYELLGKSKKNVNRRIMNIIESSSGDRVGFLSHFSSMWGTTMGAGGYELKPGVSWLQVTPTVIRYLKATGERYAARDKGKPFGGFGFWLGSEHPVYQAASTSLPHTPRPYAWYIRVPDLPGFLKHVSPVLEKRLEASVFSGHSGELKITFYQRGVRLIFEQGRLEKVEAWKPQPDGHSGDAAFPGLTFLQLIFGFRTLEELEYAYADCWADNDPARGLLEILFPKLPSDIWGVA